MAKKLNKKVFLIHVPLFPVFHVIRFFEKIGLNFPINSEQILHIDTDLDINNKLALRKYKIKILPFEERLSL
jgi:hypothetical protein